MPEGPEVKTVARTLADHLIGKRLGAFWHSEYQLRHAVDYDKIRRFENGVVDEVSCYGKLLFINVDKKPALLAQLGMTGQLTVAKRTSQVLAHTHIRWQLENTDSELRYVDPRRFGLFEACDESEKLIRIKKLGPDPFHMGANDRTRIATSIKKSARSIKEIILDQAVVVGVGNIYASEALFLSRINPMHAGNKISDKKIDALITAMIDVLKLAYKNCGTTFSNYVDGSGKKGDNLNFLKVFQRAQEPCFQCKTIIKRIKQGGRSTFFCELCQAF